MKPSEIFEGENSSLKKTYDEATKPLEEISKEFDEKFPYKIAGVIDDFGSTTKNELRDFITEEIKLAFQAGKDSMREEILNKLPERKSENKKKKDQEEWINIPRIQRAVGFNSCLNQVKNIIKNV